MRFGPLSIRCDVCRRSTAAHLAGLQEVDYRRANGLRSLSEPKEGLYRRLSRSTDCWSDARALRRTGLSSSIRCT